MTARRRGSLLLVAVVAVTSACGTTVSPREAAQASSGNNGLSAGGTTGVTSGGTAGSGQGSTSGTGGSTGTTGGGQPGRTGSTATGGVGPTTPSGTGSSSGGAVQGTLKLGVLDAKSPAAAASATGAQSAAGVDPAELTRAFIRYYNAHGGMAGRKLEPVEYTIDPTSSSYENDLSAACARFTQDNHVRLVVSQTGNLFSGNYENCLTKAGVTNLEVANGAPDASALNKYPRLFTTGSPTVDRRVTAQLRGLARTGYLSRSTPIGVIVEDCPENSTAYAKTVVPVAKSLGLTLTMRKVNCVTGFSDAGAYFAQVGSAVLPFNTAGISRVLFITSFEVAALQAFENQAQAQAYSPSYVLSSIASTAVQASQYSADAQRRMAGVGWIPVLDTTGVPQTTGAKHCSEIARSQGQTISNQSDYVFLLQVCDLFGVLDAALVAARGSDEAAAFSAGLGAAMPSYRSSDVLGERLRLGGDAHDGPPAFAPFAYVSSCSCFRYTSKPAALA